MANGLDYEFAYQGKRKLGQASGQTLWRGLVGKPCMLPDA